MTTIHFIDSEKGGTGKSWFSRIMHHILETRGIPFIGVDADTSNPTYHNIYETSQLIPFSIHPKEEDLADVLFDLAFKTDVLISLPAQAHRAVYHWFTEKNVAMLAKQHNIRICKWWISDGEDDSLNLFCESVAAYAGSIDHVFVQNYGRCTEWAYFAAHERTQATLKEHQISVIEMLHLSDLRRIPLNAKRMKFADALTYPEFGFLGQSQIQRCIRSLETALESAGAFSPPDTKPSGKSASKPNKPSKAA